MLCWHSNATRAPIANPPNSAQLGRIPYHSPKLHLGPYSSVGMWPRTDTHTHKQTRVTTIHFTSSTTHAKCDKEKTCFVDKDNKFHEYYRKENGNVCFRCTVKTCKARIETNDVIVVAEYGDHDHSDKVSSAAAVALRVSCERRAALDIALP